MDSIVRDLLDLRGIRMSPAELDMEIIGFQCLGIAERMPESSELGGSLVHVWHVGREILPISASEAECWIVDSPPGRHWILSEREMSKGAKSILKNDLIEFWGPEKLARWIGESVLSGSLDAQIPVIDKDIISESEDIDDEFTASENRRILSPIIDLDEWIIQRGIENIQAQPILLKINVWEVNGRLISPDGDGEYRNWLVIEDPWASKIEIFNESEILPTIPDIRIINPLNNMWLQESDLLVMLKGILETRRQKKNSISKGSVKSTMLERWQLESSGVTLHKTVGAIPGWLLISNDAQELLHSRNGRTYDVNCAEVP